MFNVLTEPLIRVRTSGGERNTCSLPQVLALLTADAVAEFPAQRPHQRHPWHAFLVQLAAMALHCAGRTDLPADESDWATLIRGLTPEWPGRRAVEPGRSARPSCAAAGSGSGRKPERLQDHAHRT